MTVEQARAKLGDLVIAAMTGTTTTVTRYGRAVAQLGPISRTVLYIRTDPDGVEVLKVVRTGGEVAETLIVDGDVCSRDIAYQSDIDGEVDDYLRRRDEELKGQGFNSH